MKNVLKKTIYHQGGVTSMGHDITIRPGQPDEAGNIVELIQSSFIPELFSTMIYGCSGMQQYLRDQMSLPASLSDTLYVVAVLDNNVVGYLEMRWLSDALFWNLACTNRETRCKGLAKTMLKEAISIARMDHHRSMYLDVYENNTGALTWYERMGFTCDYTTELWDIPNMVSAPATSGKISGYPQSLLSQERYGFSMFKLITAKGDYNIGCMGRDWFRVTQLEAMTDHEVFSTLNALNPDRRILALLPEKSVSVKFTPGTRQIVRTKRMSIPLNQLLENLAD
jgi:GNAT superfamily N-acetyltransferase